MSQGQFSGGPAPDSARLLRYRRERSGFGLDPRGDRVLAAVNDTSALVHAAAIFAGGRELFFAAARPGARPHTDASRSSVRTRWPNSGF